MEKGTLLNQYEIIGPIGKGGMGEVYLGQDNRLDRKVAIKVLPREFADDEDRVKRFEQEARATSALNHPNILSVHDIGEHDGSPFIVCELLEGEELRDRLDAGSIPLRKVTDYAQQIVAGLSAAHEKGIVHRDLKPENIFITKDDRVKILDFGLAKLNRFGNSDLGSGNEENTVMQPEIPNPKSKIRNLTGPGVVMGTVGYMSPEQVRGQVVDHRSDIFSFGVILYEMITGRRAFQEESMAETMSAIVKEEPPEMMESNPNISPSLERIVRRCLEKKAERRFHSAHDLGFALESLSAPTSSSGGNMTTAVSAIGPDTGRSPWLVRILGSAALMFLIAFVVSTVMYIRRPVPDLRPITFAIAPSDNAANTVNAPLISPDGRTIAFVLPVNGTNHIFIRELGSLTERRIDGTELTGPPFWSPDSRTLAFISNDKLKKVDIDGGPIQVICDAPRGFAGSWGRNGMIVLGSTSGFGTRRVSASGGEVTEILPLDESRKETRHTFPRFLPDGRHFFYRSHNSSPTDSPEIFIASIDGKERKPLFKNSSDVHYVEPGFLLFARETTVMAQPFDAASLEFTGDPVPVIDSVMLNASSGRAQFSVSDNGTLVYKRGSGLQRQLSWLDRQGKEISKAGSPGEYGQIALSPDGKRVAATLRVGGNTDIWVMDLERGLPTRFTFNAANEDDPAWSPDGNNILFSSDRGGARKIFRKSANGSGNEELISNEISVNTSGIDWSPDGRNALFASQDQKTLSDIWVLPMTGDAKPYPLLQSEFNEGNGHFSPDGRFFAYSSAESSRLEVYVQSLPPGSGKWQVSTGGGSQARWRRDGKEIYYLSMDAKLMAVPVKLDRSVEIGTAIPLFQSQIEYFLPAHRFDVSADGQRFLVNQPVETSNGPPFVVVLNWTSTLKK